MRSVNSQVVRKFDIGDNEGADEGKPQWADNEDWVMAIAADWSVNPLELDDEKYKTEKQLGISGVLASPCRSRNSQKNLKQRKKSMFSRIDLQ
jgi:hypothetical protein